MLQRIFIVLIIVFLSSRNLMAVGEASTKFFIYVPPNNDNVHRDAALIVTAIQDSTQLQIYDDDADGDSDDNFSGILSRGQSYVMYIKDNAVNDDAGNNAKQDGDYFKIIADHPVLVSQSTNSDWQHDWVPSDNKKMIGNSFYIYSPQSSYSNRDLNIFMYTNNTSISVKDITKVATKNTGLTKVDLSQSVEVANFNLSIGEDIIYANDYGRNIMESGHTYLVTATYPVTVQYGALHQNERDGGGFVPSSNGYSSGSLFYFGIPRQVHGEQEVRIVSFDDNNVISLDRFLNNSWVNITSWNLDEFDKADWIVPAGQSYDNVFRVQCSAGKKVSVFEANWLESGSPGTSDIASYISSQAGTAAGTKFICYMAPPGRETNCTDPFTGAKFGGDFSHLFFFTNTNGTEVSVKDLNTGGTVFNRTFNLDQEEYADCKLNLAEYRNIYNGDGKPESGPDRPYLVVESNNPISVFDTNWNDNWMTYAGSVLLPTIQNNAELDDDEVTTGDDIIFNSKIKNSGNQDITQTETLVKIDDGLNYKSSQLLRSNGSNFGTGNHSHNSDGTETVKWKNYQLQAGDSLTAIVEVSADSTFSNGNPIGDQTVLTIASSSSGMAGNDYIETQSSSGLSISTNSGGVNSDTMIIAFEDLKGSGWNDWDYNDFVVKITRDVFLTLTRNINKIELQFEALARGATRDHVFKQAMSFNGDALIDVTVYDSSGLILDQQSAVNFTEHADLIVFESTYNALPPLPGFNSTNTVATQQNLVKGHIVKITVEFDSPSLNPYSLYSETVFDPYLILNTNEQIHVIEFQGTGIGNTQYLDNVDPAVPLYGYYLDLALKTDKDWKWPLEQSDHSIWISYPDFIQYIKSGKNLAEDWYTNPDLQHVWNQGDAAVRTTTLFPVELTLQKPANLQEGFPLNAGSELFASPVLFEIDQDPGQEIIVGTMDGKLLVLKYDGTALAGWPQHTGSSIRSSAAVGDIDNDGEAEIVVGNEAGKVYAWNTDGTLMTGWPVSTGYPVKSSAVIADINGDLLNEIILAGGDGKIHVWDYTATELEGWPQETDAILDEYGYVLLTSSVGVIDLNNSGTMEIIFAGTDSKIYAWDCLGRAVYGFPVTADDWIYSSPVFGQFDEDPYPEIVVISGKGTVYILKYDGTHLPGFPKYLNSKIVASPALADVDGDDKLDICVGSVDKKVYLFDSGGNYLPGWPQTTFGEIISSPVVADIDGDNLVEILNAGNDGYIYVWKYDGNSSADYIHEFGSAGGWITSTLAIGNLDSDTDMDVVAASFDSSIYAFDLNTECNPENILWGMFRGSASRTGSNEFTVAEYTGTYALEKVNAFNYPNPVEEGEVTTFNIECPVIPEKIDLRIFDAAGQLVRHITEQDMILRGMAFEYDWNLKNGRDRTVANGVYFYRVDVEKDQVKKSVTGKMALIR